MNHVFVIVAILFSIRPGDNDNRASITSVSAATVNSSHANVLLEAEIESKLRALEHEVGEQRKFLADLYRKLTLILASSPESSREKHE